MAAPDVQGIVASALRSAREVVANIREFMPVYRSKSGWIHAFHAFRLPSPLSPAPSGRQPLAVVARRRTDADAARASLQRIMEAAGLQEDALPELLKLLPRAEVHRQSGCETKAAWGRAAAEFPELKGGRSLVELLLVWKPNTGNVERRFRSLGEHRATDRPRLLDITAEDLVMTDLAPPSKVLQATLQVPSSADDPPTGIREYFTGVIAMHGQLHGKQQRHARQERTQRRDAGVAKSMVGNSAPTSEAAFGRKRAAAIEEVINSTPQVRAQSMRKHSLGAVAASVATEEVFATAGAITKARKRAGEATSSYVDAPAHAKCARTKLLGRSARAIVCGQGESRESAPPGVVLVATDEVQALSMVRKNGFKHVASPLEFVREVAVAATRRNCGHLVLAEHGRTDYALAARLAAALLGAYLATPADYAANGRQCGTQFLASFNSAHRRQLYIAVSPDMSKDFPTVPLVLLRIAQAAGSRLEFLRDARSLEKRSKKLAKATPNIHRICRILSTFDEKMDADKKYQPLYSIFEDFREFVEAKVVRAVPCPGFA